MPIPYNKDFQVAKSAQLQALDCRPTGQTKTVGYDGTVTYVGVYTAGEAIEAGECVAMVRVQKGFQVLGGRLTWSSGSTACVGVGDPFCCGRLLGPINTTGGSMLNALNLQGTDCGVIMKSGNVADGCGIGYIYTCDTDIILTNGYGENSFGIGGGKTGTANGGSIAGPLAAGFYAVLVLEGVIVPNPNA